MIEIVKKLQDIIQEQLDTSSDIHNWHGINRENVKEFLTQPSLKEFENSFS